MPREGGSLPLMGFTRESRAAVYGRGCVMKYFAYGSNMSLSRLRARTPSARRLGCYILSSHALCFHKAGSDGSAKCDAFFTGDPRDSVVGVVFDIDPRHKGLLDAVEGLGHGYDEKTVQLIAGSGEEIVATTYCATLIASTLKPYTWYKNHVLIGAREAGLPAYYLRRLRAVESIEDPDTDRDQRERAVHGLVAGSTRSTSPPSNSAVLAGTGATEWKS